MEPGTCLLPFVTVGTYLPLATAPAHLCCSPAYERSLYAGCHSPPLRLPATLASPSSRLAHAPHLLFCRTIVPLLHCSPHRPASAFHCAIRFTAPCCTYTAFLCCTAAHCYLREPRYVLLSASACTASLFPHLCLPFLPLLFLSSKCTHNSRLILLDSFLGSATTATSPQVMHYCSTVCISHTTTLGMPGQSYRRYSAPFAFYTQC